MNIFRREQQLYQQSQELRKLRAELKTIKAQNESMREGMRRCISCEYRLESMFGRGK